MKILWSKGFKRSYQKVIQKNPQLKSRIADVIKILANDPFTPSIKSHKLTGNLSGLWSCSVAYDCRIIFSFSEDGKLLEMMILLIDIGSHDDVYR
ncbi:type II toxin-antitoxin system RelE/ParE family toxin [Geminocystis herdmanii]|uniref:type II toxin-antitoxin system RelE/ParE family toxin n=1 Tax=Geminocystis herdmanii TaxID=669359 RepID=UPI00034A4118|nr:type II toxin-antitoxin system mRNA interferase toxin, RelE/StbE family [Geminocystis herdmanii]